MGELAGGHLASLVAATGDRKEFEKGEYWDVKAQQCSPQ